MPSAWPLVGAEVGEPRGRPVIGVFCDDRAGSAGVGSGHPPRQLVGLSPGGSEQTGVELIGHRREESFSELDDTAVQIPRVGVHGGELTRDRLHHRGVGVADHGDIVVGIQIPDAVRRDQPWTFATHDLQRARVGERAQPATHRAATATEQVDLCGVRDNPPGSSRGSGGTGDSM